MTIQQLEYLIALDLHRNFVRAAAACNVTQPTLSMQVKKLEEEWGVLIFERGNGPLEPTQLGLEVLKHARRMLAEKQSLEDVLASSKESLTGKLNLGVIPTISPYLLPRFLHAFAHKHPGLQLLVKEMQSEEIIEALKEGSLDVGLLALPVEDQDLEEMSLFREPFWFCASSDYPALDLEAGHFELKENEGPLVLTGGHCIREQVLKFCGTSEPRDAKVLYEGGSLETLIRLVGKGEGYTLVPELAIPDVQPNGVVIREFPEPAPEREIGLIVHHRFVRRRLVEHLGKSIRENVPSKMLTRKGMRLSWRT